MEEDLGGATAEVVGPYPPVIHSKPGTLRRFLGLLESAAL
jgi:hypothetical protein